MKEKQPIGQAEMMTLLDHLYNTAINGIDQPHTKPINLPINEFLLPVEKLSARHMLAHCKSPLEASAKRFINVQIAKCSTAGFMSGLGGLLTLPIAIPANIASSLFIQLQLITTLAKMGGYDVRNDAVRTMAYMCLADLSVEQALKQSGIQLGERIAMNAIAKIPCETLRRINQRVGFRLVTKFGQRGLINLGKTVPLMGGLISGGFDAVKTKQIADRAYQIFIENPASPQQSALHSEVNYVDVAYKEV